MNHTRRLVSSTTSVFTIASVVIPQDGHHIPYDWMSCYRGPIHSGSTSSYTYTCVDRRRISSSSSLLRIPGTEHTFDTRFIFFISPLHSSFYAAGPRFSSHKTNLSSSVLARATFLSRVSSLSSPVSVLLHVLLLHNTAG